ncbi:hypothetical protein ZIOFF_074985 [Zingiber officinale]|uniref:Myb/SANT-like domain-containing protein n=1 Tax=Zingiber officinale TaxID=94328 RepID=A0A8J5BVT0_ZINOF|nr:hypothetical protein ZIOFF_074985 [Zingiber officinale]
MKEWLLFKKLMHMETGVGWNPTNNSLDASDEWWETKLRENGEYAKFRNKDLSLVWFRYDKLFSDVAATGERARAPSQQTVHCIDDNEEVMKENDDFPDFEGHIGIDDSEYNEDRGIEHDVSFGIKEKSNMGNDIVFPSLSSLKRKFNGEYGKEKKKISGATSLKEDIHSLLKYLENKSTVTSAPSTEKDIESAMVILKNIPGIEHKTELCLMEPWDVRHCALTDSNIFCEDEPIEDEDGFQDDPEWLIDCIRAIDGTHVKARLPQGKAIPYIGRKGFPT